MGAHLINGEFQSDKYPTTPRGKVPLSVRDKSAQDLLWRYAQRRRQIDSEFSDDLQSALKAAGYSPTPDKTMDDVSKLVAEARFNAGEEQFDKNFTEYITVLRQRLRRLADALESVAKDRDRYREALNEIKTMCHGDPENVVSFIKETLNAK
jgi:hypothetical protein